MMLKIVEELFFWGHYGYLRFIIVSGFKNRNFIDYLFAAEKGDKEVYEELFFVKRFYVDLFIR